MTEGRLVLAVHYNRQVWPDLGVWVLGWLCCENMLCVSNDLCEMINHAAIETLWSARQWSSTTFYTSISSAFSILMSVLTRWLCSRYIAAVFLHLNSNYGLVSWCETMCVCVCSIVPISHLWRCHREFLRIISLTTYSWPQDHCVLKSLQRCVVTCSRCRISVWCPENGVIWV